MPRRGSYVDQRDGMAGNLRHGEPENAGGSSLTRSYEAGIVGSGRPYRAPRLGDQVYGLILQEIVAGHFSPDERLPSENQLCELYGVSRPIVREAISRLQADGLVVSRQGSGTFVNRRPSPDILRFASMGDVADLLRCFELRIGLEGEAAFLAAQRRRPPDMSRIKKALDALDDAIQTGAVGSDVDLAFHKAVAAASGNDLFVQILQGLDHTITAGMTLARNLSLQRSVERLRLVQQEHVEIFEAINEADAEAARATMRCHIGNARRRVLDETAVG